MAGSPPVIYVDSCVFIAAITGEKRPGDESQHVAGVMGELERRELVAVTSAITRTEILECSLNGQQQSVLDRLIAPPKTQVKDVTRPILDLAGEIRNFYQAEKLAGRTNLPTVALPDAIHLATAIYFDCRRMFTFDQADRPENTTRPQRGLIPLSGTIAGRYELEIMKPYSAAKGLNLG